MEGSFHQTPLPGFIAINGINSNSQLLRLGINQRRHVSGWKKKARQMGILFSILKSIPEEFNFKVPVIAAGKVPFVFIQEEDIQPIKTKAVSRTEKTSCGIHEREHVKRLNQIETARGSSRVKLVGKYSMKMDK
ncbi:hypothetical protein ACFX19_002672 [Malus domestica]